MHKMLLAAAFAGALAAGAPSSWAGRSGDGFGAFEPVQFAVLPDGVRFPEGIAANPATGDIYVGTFDFGPNSNALLRFGRNGRLVAQKNMGSAPLLGLGFGPDGKVYILNTGALTGGQSKVQRIAASFGASTPVEDVAVVPSIGAPGSRTVGNPDGSSDTIVFGSAGAPVPNGMVFDAAGNLYFSDSFQGAIFRIADAATCSPCTVTTFAHDPLLATAGFPPFGANGLALSADGATMFIANTGDNRVLKMDMASATISVFAESVHGADGLLLDQSTGLLWVAANQGDQLVALDANGRPVLKVGDFEGIRNGTPRGFLFPASMVIQSGFMYVTNLALPLTAAVGDEPEEDVTRWNVVRFRIDRH
jgi:DNA-binding beta-propeller fold protein YncE